MKLLLMAINAKYIHSNPAVYLLKAYASDVKENVVIREYTINNSESSILADVFNEQPDIIAIATYIWNRQMVDALVSDLEKVLPDTPVWIGGPEGSYNANAFLENHNNIEGIIIGEGEVTFKELAKAYVDYDCKKITYEILKSIKGLCIRNNENKIEYTGARPLLSMNEIPFPYDNLEIFKNRIIYYETSRGCPFNCSYCLSSVEHKVRIRDFELVKKELQFFLDNKVNQVKFVDRTFNADRKHALQIWKYLLENDNGITNFHFEISADIIDDEELEILRKMRPGLVQFEIGVQTTNAKTIESIRRTMNLERLKNVVSKIHKNKNIHVHLDLIAGLPFEDITSFEKSFNDVFAMKPDQLQLGFLKVLSGASMAEEASEYGIVYSDRPPYEVLKTNWLPYKDVLELKAIEEMVEQYYNSNQYQNTLRYVMPFYESAFVMFQRLAKYMKQEGFDIMTPSRMKKYEIFLDFLEGEGIGNIEIIKECLVFDLYLRENCKSRPSFATNAKISKTEKKDESRDLHFEHFNYPVWSERENIEEKGDYVVRFNYKNRNSLSGNADFTME